MHVHREEQAWKLSLSLSLSLNNLHSMYPVWWLSLAGCWDHKRGTAKIFLNKSVLGSWHVFSITKVYKKPCGCDAKASAAPSALCSSGWEWRMSSGFILFLHLLLLCLLSSPVFSVSSPPVSSAPAHMCLFGCTSTSVRVQIWFSLQLWTRLIFLLAEWSPWIHAVLWPFGVDLSCAKWLVYTERWGHGLVQSCVHTKENNTCTDAQIDQALKG